MSAVRVLTCKYSLLAGLHRHLGRMATAEISDCACCGCSFDIQANEAASSRTARKRLVCLTPPFVLKQDGGTASRLRCPAQANMPQQASRPARQLWSMKAEKLFGLQQLPDEASIGAVRHVKPFAAKWHACLPRAQQAYVPFEFC